MDGFRAALKKKELMPLFVTVGGGMLLAGAYVMRLATHEHVTWGDKTSQPWANIDQSHRIRLMGYQKKSDKEIFKSGEGEDLRGKL